MLALLDIRRRRLAAWIAAGWLACSKATLRLHDKWLAIAQRPAEDMHATRGIIVAVLLAVPCWLVLWLLWRWL